MEYEEDFFARKSKRAKRRSHKIRMKRKAANIAKSSWGYGDPDFAREDIVADSVKNADHLASCSCSGCCNVRRSKWSPYQGKTIKEIQADIEDY